MLLPFIKLQLHFNNDHKHIEKIEQALLSVKMIKGYQFSKGFLHIHNLN